MKSKLLLLPALVLGLAAFGGAAAAFSHNSVSEAKAYSPDDTYTATSDHFVASMNRNNALRDAYSGDDNYGDSTRKENITIADMDHTSSISWKVSIAKYSYDSFRNLKMGNKGKTIEGHADQEFADIYTATGVATGHYMSAMYSTTAITNLQDMFVTWGAQGGQLHESAFGDIYFLAKDGTGWHLIKSYNAGYGSDDRGTTSTWNHVVAKIGSDKMSAANVLGENVQIAIAYDSGTSASSNSFVCLHTIMVNRVASAKATMHYWDKGGNDLELCTYITDTKANNSVRIAMFAYQITQEQVDALDVAANFEYHNAKESTYYRQLAYLCDQAGVDLSLTPTASNYIVAFINKDNNVCIFALIASLVIGVAGVGVFFSIRKRKHN